MIKASVNGEESHIETAEEMDRVLVNAARCSPCDLWLRIDDGPSICLLRQGDYSWLMYLRDWEDAGFVSIGNFDAPGKAEFTLSNGQVDEYPVAWCIPLEQALRAVSQFWHDRGKRSDEVEWWETEPGDEW